MKDIIILEQPNNAGEDFDEFNDRMEGAAAASYDVQTEFFKLYPDKKDLLKQFLAMTSINIKVAIYAILAVVEEGDNDLDLNAALDFLYTRSEKTGLMMHPFVESSQRPSDIIEP